MIDYAVHSLTPVAPHVQQNAGLLYTPGDALLGMAYFAIMALAGYLMLSYAGSIAPLWAPVAAFLRGLHALSSLIKGLVCFTCALCVLPSVLDLTYPPPDDIEDDEWPEPDVFWFAPGGPDP